MLWLLSTNLICQLSFKPSLSFFKRFFHQIYRNWELPSVDSSALRIFITMQSLWNQLHIVIKTHGTVYIVYVYSYMCSNIISIHNSYLAIFVDFPHFQFPDNVICFIPLWKELDINVTIIGLKHSLQYLIRILGGGPIPHSFNLEIYTQAPWGKCFKSRDLKQYSSTRPLLDHNNHRLKFLSRLLVMKWKNILKHFIWMHQIMMHQFWGATNETSRHFLVYDLQSFNWRP